MKSLADEVSAFEKSKPNTYRIEVDPDAGRYCVRVTVERPPPPKIAVVCGDYIHCVRSALDHIACGLVRKSTRRTQFPIYAEADDFLCGVTLPARRKRPGPLTGLDSSGPLFTYIEQTQPYNGPHGLTSHPLYLLAKLSNADKHRTILTLACAHEASSNLKVMGDGFDFIGKAQLIYDKPLVDGAIVLRGQFKANPGPDLKMQVQGYIPLEVAFGEGILVPSKSQ